MGKSNTQPFLKTDKCSWSVSGDNFYLSARIMWSKLGDKGVPLYLSSQAVERYLKSILAHFGASVSYVWKGELHNLQLLLEEVNKYIAPDKIPIKIRDFILKINVLGESTRYPDKPANYEWSDVDMWLLDDTVNLLKSLLNSPECADDIQRFISSNPDEAQTIFTRKKTVQIGGSFLIGGDQPTMIPITNPLQTLNNYFEDKSTS